MAETFISLPLRRASRVLQPSIASVALVSMIVVCFVLQAKVLPPDKGSEETLSQPRVFNDNLVSLRKKDTSDPKSLVSSISEVVHELPPLEQNELPFASNFYEILQGITDDCLPTSLKCIACLRNKIKGANCVSCASACPCYCRALCNTALDQKFVSKTLIVKPPIDSKTQQRLIPRIIHQTYSESITRQKYPNFSRMVQSFQSSGWEYSFYTDAESYQFLKSHFPPEILEAYQALRPGAFRADLFRYCVLLIHGGVYADIDVMLQSNLDIVIEPDMGFMVPLDQPGIYTGDQMCLWNGFMAAAPGHPFLAKAIETVVNQVRGRFTGVDIANSFCPNPELSLLHAHDLLFLTGPCLLGGSVNRVLGLHGLHPFEIGEMDTSDLESAGIPGRTILLEQRKRDFGFHTFTDAARNLLVAGTDLPNADDRIKLNATYEHYSKTREISSIYGVASVYVDNKMVDEEIRIEVENAHLIQQWKNISGSTSKQGVSMSFEFPSVQERVKYYMGSWYESQKFDAERFCSEVQFYQSGLPPIDVPYIFNDLNINDHPQRHYANDIKRYLLQPVADSNIVVSIGDESPGGAWPVITKSRHIDSFGKKNILALLHERRHFRGLFFDMVKKNHVTWYEKKEMIVWRGSSTGGAYRIDFVKKYFNATQDGIDVAFNQLVDGYENDTEAQSLVGRTMEPNEMLEYKYLLALEGNDVASCLKRMMFSNSVVFMAPPRFESWAMEGLLIPYYHYIPLAPDLSDLKEKLEWARLHDSLCRQIAHQATHYIEELYFSARAKEQTKQVHNEMMKRYYRLYGHAISATC
jgi:Glycosyl transferase family 90/Glycosyltransferase sugar-binding region containing DXD motif